MITHFAVMAWGDRDPRGRGDLWKEIVSIRATRESAVALICKLKAANPQEFDWRHGLSIEEVVEPEVDAA